MNFATRIVAAALLAGGLASASVSPASAQEAYAGPVAVIVAIPIPAGLTRPAIDALFIKTAPIYQAIPQLKQKYFTVNATRAGGIYLWTSRAAADAYYNDTWKARVTKTYGAPAELTFFDVPLVIQGAAGMNAQPAQK